MGIFLAKLQCPSWGHITSQDVLASIAEMFIWISRKSGICAVVTHSLPALSCLHLSLPLCLRAWLPAWLASHLPACLPDCLPACLSRTCLAACLAACLPACRPASPILLWVVAAAAAPALSSILASPVASAPHLARCSRPERQQISGAPLPMHPYTRICSW